MPEQDEMLARLRRLRQLAQEICGALDRNDMEVAARAASLLAPTLASRQAFPGEPGHAAWSPEAAEIVQETQALLQESVARLTQSMNGLSGALRRLRRGKRVVAVVKNRRMPAAGGKLNTGR